MRCSDKLQLGLTCGKHDISRHQLVVDDGELRQLDPCHPRHGRFASFPVELDVVCGVAICTGKKKTRQGVTICRTVAGDPRTVVLLLHLTGCQLGRAPKKYTGGKKKTCLKLFPDDQTLLWKGRRLIGFAPVHVNFRSTRGNSRHLLVLKNLRLLLKDHYGVSISMYHISTLKCGSSVFSTFNRERF